MTKSTQFGKFEVQTKDSGDTLVWEHLPTGKTYEFDETGEFAPPSINTERGSVGDVLSGDVADQIHITTNSATTLTVPDDAATVQEAINQVYALAPRHDATIVVDTSAYSAASEDIYVPGQIATGSTQDAEAQPVHIQIKPDTANRWAVNSILIHNAVVEITGANVQGTAPPDEGAGIACFGGRGESYLFGCRFEDPASGGPDKGVLSYGSAVKLDGNGTIGTEWNNQTHALVAKRSGAIYATRPASGTVDYIAEALGGYVIDDMQPSLTVNTSVVDRTNGEAFVLSDGVDYSGKPKTHVQTRRDNNSVTASSGVWTEVAPDETEDVNNEFDSASFQPSRSGLYQVSASAFFFSLTDGDRCEVAVRDVDAGSVVDDAVTRKQASGTDATVTLSRVIRLTAGTNYRIEGTDKNNSYRISPSGSAASITWLRP